MRKKLSAILILLILLVAVPQAFAQYNRSAVLSVMRGSYALLGEIKNAAKSDDYYTAALKLMELAEGFKSLQEVSPPRGSEAEWDRLHGEVVEAAFRGIGACGEKDKERLDLEISKIMELNKEGHSKFR